MQGSQDRVGLNDSYIFFVSAAIVAQPNFSASGGSNRISSVTFRRPSIDSFSQIARKLVGIHRFERALLHFLQRHQVTGFTFHDNPTTSFIPPTVEATTAASQAIASRLMIPNGS